MSISPSSAPSEVTSRREVVFDARGLTKFYRMGEVEVQALRGLDLQIYAGEFIVLLGPSGSGKSTLLNILGGLDSASSGVVHYRDHKLVEANEQELTRYRREHVGFIFQFYNLIPRLTATENVALVTEIAENPMAPDEALALVGLECRLAHFPSQMPAASSSGWPWRGTSPSGRTFCYATNQLARWTTRPASWSFVPSPRLAENWARPRR